MQHVQYAIDICEFSASPEGQPHILNDLAEGAPKGRFGLKTLEDRLLIGRTGDEVTGTREDLNCDPYITDVTLYEGVFGSNPEFDRAFAESLAAARAANLFVRYEPRQVKKLVIPHHYQDVDASHGLLYVDGLAGVDSSKDLQLIYRHGIDGYLTAFFDLKRHKIHYIDGKGTISRPFHVTENQLWLNTEGESPISDVVYIILGGDSGNLRKSLRDIYPRDSYFCLRVERLHE